MKSFRRRIKQTKSPSFVNKKVILSLQDTAIGINTTVLLSMFVLVLSFTTLASAQTMQLNVTSGPNPVKFL